jgi:hypothetical protein
MSDKIEKDLVDPAVEPVTDKIYRTTQFAVSAIGAVNGIPGVAEVFSLIVESPLDKRRKKWAIQVTDAINDLIDKGVMTDSELASNEVFLSAVMEASQQAIRTHQAEKIEALLNSIKSSARETIESDYQKLFYNYLNQFTVMHLGLIKSIEINCNQSKEPWEKLIQEISTQYFSGDARLFYTMVEELEVGKGLIESRDQDYILTDLGYKFQKFISSQ